MNNQPRNANAVMQELWEEAKKREGIDLQALESDIDRNNRMAVTILVKVRGFRDLQVVQIYDMWHFNYNDKNKELECFFGERVGNKFECWVAFIKNVKTILAAENDSLAFELNSDIALDLLKVERELRP